MNLCSRNHDEICFDGRRCPLCEEIQQREAKEHEVDRLKESMDAADDEIGNLQAQLDLAQENGKRLQE